SELNSPMISLKINRSGFRLIAVEGSPGYSGDDLVADHRSTIDYYRHLSPNQSDIERLPFARILRHHLVGGKESINTAEQSVLRLHSLAIHDLHFVSTAKINSTVAAFWVTEF